MMHVLEYKILDEGYLKLVDFMGTDETIIESARMSTGRGFEGWEPFEVCNTCGWRVGYPLPARDCDYEGNHHVMVKKPGDAKLLETLYSMGHMTPFEMCEISMEVQAPLMVFREWHRHRTMSYNEFSARYAVMPNIHYVPEPGRIAKQSRTNKQGSGEVFSLEDALGICSDLANEQEAVYQNYDRLIQMGVANELARLNTPVSRYSRMRVKTDLRNWMSFLSLRMDLAAQKEIRQFANAAASVIRELYPKTFALFVEHNFFAVKFSRMEMRHLREMMREHLAVDKLKYTASAFLTEKQLATFANKLTENKESKYADVDAFKGV